MWNLGFSEPTEYLMYAEGSAIKTAQMVPDLTTTGVQPSQKEFPVLPFLKTLEVDISFRRVYAYLDMPQNGSIVWFPMNVPESIRRLVDNTKILRMKPYIFNC